MYVQKHLDTCFSRTFAAIQITYSENFVEDNAINLIACDMDHFYLKINLHFLLNFLQVGNLYTINQLSKQ